MKSIKKEYTNSISLVKFIQANVKNIFFMKLDSRYGEYFPEYATYFGIPLIPKKSIYGMNNSWKLFADELTNVMIYEAGLKQYKFQMYVYYKYALGGPRLVVLSNVYECVYWYTSEELGEWFVNTPRKIFHTNLLGYSHWFMSIRISQLKEHYISVDQDRYATSVVAKYLDTDTIRER